MRSAAIWNLSLTRLAARAGIPYTGFHFSCPSQFTRTFLGADFMLA